MAEKGSRIISNATARNWKRLSTNPEGRLSNRANKLKSSRRFVPVEYLTYAENIQIIENIVKDFCKFKVFDVIYSLAINLLIKKGIYEKSNIKKILAEYCKKYNVKVIDELTQIQLPDEYDILGILYQSILTEGEKNKRGSYYTPKNIVEDMVCDIALSGDMEFLDPCCGSGAYLMAVKTDNPMRLHGVDSDKIAVFIAKINLVLKYSDVEFEPDIICVDFLDYFDKRKYDYIVTNPPWGSVHKKAGEIFTHFYFKAFELLKNNASIRFLFPVSVLNVKAHRELRKFIIENCEIERIVEYDRLFTGVVTSHVNISSIKGVKSKELKYIKGSDERTVRIEAFYETENLFFNPLSADDIYIIRKVKSKSEFSLKNSTWALGIVTGDNKNKLFKTIKENTEPIYRGKDILPYVLKEPEYYIVYDRNNFQQSARDDIYRAEEKLVYKFISSMPVFAYDNTKSLFLNSANILIPDIENMSVKTVMAFLNSKLYRYLYKKLFGEVKVLRGNLEELPFPSITQEQDKNICSLADEYIKDSNAKTLLEIDEIIYEIFEIDEPYKNVINEALNVR